MRKSLFLGCLSLLIVGFGQPGWIPLFAPLAAAFGYALFWRAFLIFPSKKKRFWTATLWFTLVQTIHLSWMTSHEYQGIYILFLYAFLSVGLGVQFGFLSLLIPKKGLLRFPRLFLLVSTWTLFEWVRFFILCGFSFNPVGLALTGSVFSLQFAALWGVLGLSFWVMLTNGLAFNACRWQSLVFGKLDFATFLTAGFRGGTFQSGFNFEGRVNLTLPEKLNSGWKTLSRKTASKKLQSRGKKSLLATWILVASIPYLFGWSHLAYHRIKALAERHISAALVQPGLLPSQKVLLSGRSHAFIPPLEQWRRILFFLSRTKKESFDLIALPEAALPFVIDNPLYPLEIARRLLAEELGEAVLNSQPPLTPPYAKGLFVSNAFFVQTLANFFHSEVIAGFDGCDTLKQKSFNAAYHFIPNTQAMERYEKRLLMPIAEYLPFEWARGLAKKYGISSFFEPGTRAKVFQGIVPFAVSICYEETFPHLIREGRREGARLFVNLTNDNWYPNSRLPQQHFDLGRLRTVENGTPLLRACNSGITASVDSLGRVVSKLGTGGSSSWRPGIVVTELSTYHYKTLYLFWGNSGIIALSCLLVVFSLVSLNNSRVKEKRSSICERLPSKGTCSK